MMAAEFGSTGAAEILVFHALSAGKGMKPFRLAPCPRLIPLHALGGAVELTCKLTLLEVALPGSGFTTVTVKFPAEVAVPVAVNCVAETNDVASAELESVTCAPDTKFVPVTASENAPVLIDDGVMPAIEGIGLRISTVTVLVSDESLVLAA